MQLQKLLTNTPIKRLMGPPDREILSLEFDSRRVERGALFFAIEGSSGDGHDYIGKAIDRGAVAIVCERLPETLSGDVSYAVVENSSEAMGQAASAFYGHPSRKLQLVGVTGTNGKTTTATLLHDLFGGLGYRAGLISTVRYSTGARQTQATHTTPDALTLNSLLAEMVDAGCDYCFMEVSSHALAQRRTAGLHYAGGIFTNLTHDHLDYHHTFAEYIRAKKLFFDNLSPGAFALTNADDRNGKVMVQNTKAHVYTYSLHGFADFKCQLMETAPEGMLLKMGTDEVWVKFLGRFNAYNLTAVYGAARILGVDNQEVLTRLSLLNPVSGRFETILSNEGITAIVDYAHTPDALKNVIDTINSMRQGSGKLYTVVGCGGDRDKSKRPAMGAIAAEGSDLAIFTSDNPRHEDAGQIIEQMEAGVAPGSGKYLSIADRRQAIKTAGMMARRGDYILIAGKGHETYQIIGETKYHFDDREEISRFFETEPK